MTELNTEEYVNWLNQVIATDFVSLVGPGVNLVTALAEWRLRWLAVTPPEQFAGAHANYADYVSGSMRLYGPGAGQSTSPDEWVSHSLRAAAVWSQFKELVESAGMRLAEPAAAMSDNVFTLRRRPRSD